MILRVYFDVDMRMGANGLREMCKTKRLAMSHMKDTDFVLFLNRKKTSFKMLSASGYLVSFTGQKYLTMDDIEKVPQIFGSDKSLLQGKNLDKVHEIVSKNLKVFEDGELKVS